jgi:hypothetical protein
MYWAACLRSCKTPDRRECIVIFFTLLAWLAWDERGWTISRAYLVFLDVAPRAFGVLLSAAHAGSQILETVHVETATPVARRYYSFSAA